MTADVIGRLTFHRDWFPTRWDISVLVSNDHYVDHVWGVAWDVAWDAMSSKAKDAMTDRWTSDGAGRYPALRDAIMALYAWPEDSALLLDMPVDAVRLLAASGHHPAVLMLPACIALNGERDGAMGPPT